MYLLKKYLTRIKDEKFEKQYPFLILSPRIPLEEELGISKEEVLINYNKFILGDLFDELKKLGFIQRGNSTMLYRCLSNGIMISIDFHRNVKSFSIFSVICRCTPLFIELDYLSGYSVALTKLDGLSIYDFDCQNEVVAKQSYDYIIKIIKTKAIQWFESLQQYDNVVSLIRKYKSIGDWDTIISFLLREGRLSEAIEEINYIKTDRFFTSDKSYDSDIKDKLKYYEKLISDGKEACMLAMQKREKKNKKRFKVK